MHDGFDLVACAAKAAGADDLNENPAANGWSRFVNVQRSRFGRITAADERRDTAKYELGLRAHN
jgi:hypothetical protein